LEKTKRIWEVSGIGGTRIVFLSGALFRNRSRSISPHKSCPQVVGAHTGIAYIPMACGIRHPKSLRSAFCSGLVTGRYCLFLFSCFDMGLPQWGELFYFGKFVKGKALFSCKKIK
jgi:hypothetical protein